MIKTSVDVKINFINIERMKPLKFEKIKNGFFNILYKIVGAVVKFFRWLKRCMDRLLLRLPIQEKYKRVLSMVCLTLVLVIVALVSVPVVKTVGNAAQAIADGITGGDDSNASAVSIDKVVSAPELEEYLPETIEAPENDIINIPTGSAAWRFSESEVNTLQRLMVYLERCNSFEYGDPRKDEYMALTAFRCLIETNDTNLSTYNNRTQYSVRNWTLNKYINGFFGRNLKSGDSWGNILLTGGSYIYMEPDPGPIPATGYITGAYSLGDNFYKITGLVTRGLASEEGRYSRQMSVILLKNSNALYGYYVVSLVNEPVGYTYIDTLRNYVPDYGDFSEDDGSASSPVTSSAPVSSATSQPPTDSSSQTDSGASSDAVSSTASESSVSQPQVTDDLKKVSLSSADKKNLGDLFTALPDVITDFDAADPASEATRTLFSHLMLCGDAEIDFSKNETVNKYSDINEKSKVIFGTELHSFSGTTDQDYVVEPYIITGKSEYKISEAYELGSNLYLIVCEVDYYSNPLLSQPDVKYQYTAVVEKSESALYKYFLKSQVFTKK